MPALLADRKARRFRQDVKAFKGKITTPGTGAFAMPANASLYFKSVAGCAAGTTAATVGSRTIKAPLLAAGAFYRAGWFERGKPVTPVSGFDVLIDKGLGKLVKIGQG